MTPPIAIYDACVLYSAPLRDLLVRLAIAGLVRAHWTEEIHAEWIRGVLADRKAVTAESLERCRSLMNSAVRDSLIEGHESLTPTLSLPDPDDRHVLAAAIHVQASLIVTFNLKDFPAVALQPHGVTATHPDDLLAQLLEDAESLVCQVIRNQRLALKNPTVTVQEHLATFEKIGLTQATARLRNLEEKL